MCTLEELECIPAGNTAADPGKHLTLRVISPSELPGLKLGPSDGFSGQGKRANLIKNRAELLPNQPRADSHVSSIRTTLQARNPQGVS